MRLQRIEQKELVILHGEIQTPPMGEAARTATGQLLRRLQTGAMLSMPESRPMPTIGAQVHELRVNDEHQIWRVIYRIDEDAIVVAEVFSKRTPQTPLPVIRNSQQRYRNYDG